MRDSALGEVDGRPSMEISHHPLLVPAVGPGSPTWTWAVPAELPRGMKCRMQAGASPEQRLGTSEVCVRRETGREPAPVGFQGPTRLAKREAAPSSHRRVAEEQTLIQGRSWRR